MFYTIKHKLHGEDLGAIIEAESEEQAFKILFTKGNFGQEREKFLLSIEASQNVETPLSKIKYKTLTNKRIKKYEPIVIQWYKG